MPGLLELSSAQCSYWLSGDLSSDVDKPEWLGSQRSVRPSLSSYRYYA
jgi:hypothetical protein